MTSLAMDDADRTCDTCEELLAKWELDRCDRCRTCPFCGSNFTVVQLNGIVVERRCHKCNAYTESYLDPL
jgi:hypothetical protein